MISAFASPTYVLLSFHILRCSVKPARVSCFVHAYPGRTSGRVKQTHMRFFFFNVGIAVRAFNEAATWLDIFGWSQQFVFSKWRRNIFLGMNHKIRKFDFRKICRTFFSVYLMEYSRICSSCSSLYRLAPRTYKTCSGIYTELSLFTNSWGWNSHKLCYPDSVVLFSSLKGVLFKFFKL